MLVLGPIFYLVIIWFAVCLVYSSVLVLSVMVEPCNFLQSAHGKPGTAALTNSPSCPLFSVLSYLFVLLR